jgi:tetratricopeptide (TPR) repeat protein
MSARTRVLTVVALAAAAAVTATVGVTLLQTRGETTTAPGAVAKPRTGAPPLQLDFGVRRDAEASALTRAQSLYAKGRRTDAGAIFARYRSVDAEVGAAFARWPDGSLDELKRIVASHPRSAFAELHLGWALYWSGRNADALGAWQRAAELEPDSPAAVDAQTALHPTMVPGLPYIVTELRFPRALESLPAEQQLAALAAAARRPGADAAAKLRYGIFLWNIRRPISAERQFRAAARLAPNDPTAQTIAAVGLFSKNAPVRAFARLGPLTGVFPQAAVVRFHLGLLLLWTRKVEKAERQLRLVIADEPSSIYAEQAKTLITALAHNGTK